jgi:general secretion pathway protein J
MTNSILAKRHKRAARHRSGEEGLTMIELILALVILVLLTGFLAGGLTLGRRAFSADRQAQVEDETDAAIQAITAVVGSALPAWSGAEGQSHWIVFDGRSESISFVGLSQGSALRGGRYKIGLKRTGTDLVMEVIPADPYPAMNHPTAENLSVTVLKGVRNIHFSYYGKMTQAGEPTWRTEWLRAELLPELVSVQVDFDDSRRNQPTILIAIRQG